jgi:hypothetical protein
MHSSAIDNAEGLSALKICKHDVSALSECDRLLLELARKALHAVHVLDVGERTSFVVIRAPPSQREISSRQLQNPIGRENAAIIGSPGKRSPSPRLDEVVEQFGQVIHVLTAGAGRFDERVAIRPAEFYFSHFFDEFESAIAGGATLLIGIVHSNWIGAAELRLVVFCN